MRTVTSRIEKGIVKTLEQYSQKGKVKAITGSLSDQDYSSLQGQNTYSYIIVYIICCGFNVSCIGKTKRHTNTRYCEHLGISPLNSRYVRIAK